MKLLEYEAKNLLTHYTILVPKGTLVTANTLPSTVPIVLKSQVPVGGRGKAGGVVIVTKPKDIIPTVNRLLKLPIKGYTPRALLAEEKIDIVHELYISLTIDQTEAAVRLTAHKDGGVDVEGNENFFTTIITQETLQTCAKSLTTYFSSSDDLVYTLLSHLFKAFTQNDATLLEINPLLYTRDDAFVCGDCKMELDDAAAFRHDWYFEAKPTNTNFVTLNENGVIATIANGAGLAMATVDAITSAGFTAANFLDIGGGANIETILDAFQKINEFPHVHAIIINIFAGITRCDEVARAIIAAKHHTPALPSLFIRLAGTNFEEAVELLAAENIPTLPTLEECLTAARKKAYA